MSYMFQILVGNLADGKTDKSEDALHVFSALDDLIKLYSFLSS